MKAKADTVCYDDVESVYRQYNDIGREDGTWMDPKWGASGRRIEFTVDVCFYSCPVMVLSPSQLAITVATVCAQQQIILDRISAIPTLPSSTKPTRKSRVDS